MKTYTVKTGDTLSSIAQKHNTTVRILVDLNGIKNPDLIYTGQVIRLPETVEQKPTVSNDGVATALRDCLDAIEKLPEFKKLEAVLNGTV